MKKRGLAPHTRDQKRSKVFERYLLNYQYFAMSYRSGNVPLADCNIIMQLLRSFIT